MWESMKGSVIRGVRELKGCTKAIIIFQPTPKPILKCIEGDNDVGSQ